eukprot:6176266-Pleurochrysis_carterae.AAC.3
MRLSGNEGNKQFKTFSTFRHNLLELKDEANDAARSVARHRTGDSAPPSRRTAARSALTPSPLAFTRELASLVLE